MKNGKNATELAIYLMLVSGRRISEISDKSLKFSKKKGDNKIYISGLLKRKEGQGGEFGFPILTSVSVFTKTYRKFIQMMKGRSDSTLNNTVNRKLKSMFGDEFRSHKMRVIYANYIFKFNNPENLKINTVWLEHLIGYGAQKANNVKKEDITKINPVYFDNIVIASKYIGPITPEKK